MLVLLVIVINCSVVLRFFVMGFFSSIGSLVCSSVCVIGKCVLFGVVMIVVCISFVLINVLIFGR